MKIIGCIFYFIFSANFDLAYADIFNNNLSTMLKDTKLKKDFMVAFYQTNYSALRNKNSDYQGTLEFSYPNKFRWEVKKPNSEIYISDGLSFYKYTEISKTFQKMPVQEIQFLNFISDFSLVEKAYSIEEWKKKDGEIKPEAKINEIKDQTNDKLPNIIDGGLFLYLKPKEDSNQEKAYLSYNLKYKFLNEIRIFYTNLNKSQIVFENYKYQSINKNRFEIDDKLLKKKK